jgi:hypothetical protein
VGEVAGVGAVPGVDGLVRVADDAQVVRSPSQASQQVELERVDVLELVDEEVPEAPVLGGGELGSAVRSRMQRRSRSSKSTSRRRFSSS